MPRVYIGIGSNLAAPREQVETALAELRQLPGGESLIASPLYRSKPVGPQDQPDYVNAVAEVDTALSPHALLHTLQALELAAGRQRLRHWGERTLDLDILLFGDRIIEDAQLMVPHPLMAERSFVLLPMCDIAPAQKHPQLGKTLAQLLHQLSGSGYDPGTQIDVDLSTCLNTTR